MDKNVLKKAIDHYGSHNQMLKCIEECGELSRAISRILVELSSGDGQTTQESQNNLYEEIADVYITLEQLMIMFDCGDEVAVEVLRKLRRLEERIENTKDN